MSGAYLFRTITDTPQIMVTQSHFSGSNRSRRALLSCFINANPEPHVMPIGDITAPRYSLLWSCAEAIPCWAKTSMGEVLGHETGEANTVSVSKGFV